MRTVYKYPLPSNVNNIAMPIGAKVLYVHIQNHIACLWAEVETDHATKTRRFYVAGTGFKLPNNIKGYIGSVITTDESEVYHVYEVECYES